MTSTNFLFTKKTVKRNKTFDELRSLFVASGWILDTEKTTNDYFYYYSTGSKGDTFIGVRLSPYDYLGTSSTYDIRTTSYSNANYRYYYKEGSTVTTVTTTYNVIPFISGRGINSGSGYGITSAQDSNVDMYLYGDKDRIIVANYSFEKGNGTCFMIGLPTESYLDETLLPINSSCIEVSTTITNTQGSLPYVRSVSTPKTVPDKSSVLEYPYTILPPKPSGLSEPLQLTEIYYGGHPTSSASYGIRGKLGGIYTLPETISTLLVYGDTINANIEGIPVTLAYIPFLATSNSSTSFVNNSIALRIA